MSSSQDVPAPHNSKRPRISAAPPAPPYDNARERTEPAAAAAPSAVGGTGFVPLPSPASHSTTTTTTAAAAPTATTATTTASTATDDSEINGRKRPPPAPRPQPQHQQQQKKPAAAGKQQKKQRLNNTRRKQVRAQAQAQQQRQMQEQERGRGDTAEWAEGGGVSSEGECGEQDGVEREARAEARMSYAVRMQARAASLRAAKARGPMFGLGWVSGGGAGGGGDDDDAGAGADPSTQYSEALGEAAVADSAAPAARWFVDLLRLLGMDEYMDHDHVCRKLRSVVRHLLDPVRPEQRSQWSRAPAATATATPTANPTAIKATAKACKMENSNANATSSAGEVAVVTPDIITVETKVPTSDIQDQSLIENAVAEFLRKSVQELTSSTHIDWGIIVVGLKKYLQSSLSRNGARIGHGDISKINTNSNAAFWDRNGNMLSNGTLRGAIHDLRHLISKGADEAAHSCVDKLWFMCKEPAKVATAYAPPPNLVEAAGLVTGLPDLLNSMQSLSLHQIAEVSGYFCAVNLLKVLLHTVYTNVPIPPHVSAELSHLKFLDICFRTVPLCSPLRHTVQLPDPIPKSTLCPVVVVFLTKIFKAHTIALRQKWNATFALRMAHLGNTIYATKCALRCQWHKQKKSKHVWKESTKAVNGGSAQACRLFAIKYSNFPALLKACFLGDPEAMTHLAWSIWCESERKCLVVTAGEFILPRVIAAQKELIFSLLAWATAAGYTPAWVLLGWWLECTAGRSQTGKCNGTFLAAHLYLNFVLMNAHLQYSFIDSSVSTLYSKGRKISKVYRFAVMRLVKLYLRGDIHCGVGALTGGIQDILNVVQAEARQEPTPPDMALEIDRNSLAECFQHSSMLKIFSEEKRQWILSAYSHLQGTMRTLTALMAHHPRVGRQSPLRVLPFRTLSYIAALSGDFTVYQW